MRRLVGFGRRYETCTRVRKRLRAHRLAQARRRGVEESSHSAVTQGEEHVGGRSWYVAVCACSHPAV